MRNRPPCDPTKQDPVKEVASLQLLQGGQAGGGGHDGVEELIEAMADDTTLYKISPWYSGGELFDYAPLPEDAAKSVFTQILDAVAFVHRQGVCAYRIRRARDLWTIARFLARLSLRSSLF